MEQSPNICIEVQDVIHKVNLTMNEGKELIGSLFLYIALVLISECKSLENYYSDLCKEELGK